MLDIKDVRLHLVRPILQRCKLYSRSAESLIIGTGLVESNFNYLVQHPGPAVGFWQMEPTTFTWLTFKLSQNKDLRFRIMNVLGYGAFPTDVNNLIYNPALACIMARLKYWFDPTKLPGEDNIQALAHYWARVYNSKNNEEDIKRFIDLYDRYGEHHID